MKGSLALKGAPPKGGEGLSFYGLFGSALYEPPLP